MNNEIPKVKRSIYSLYIKRLIDIVLSGLAIVVLSPILLILAVLELIYHGSPIIYAQERPGLNGKIFKIYKFRSMTNDTDEYGNLLPEEKRVTSFGKFIRRFSLDELPELFCIFTGKMSIIGPRPLLPEYMDMYTERHKMRHSVRPGLACVSIKPMKTWTWNDQFENDMFYIENVSFMLDLKMIFAILREAVIGSEYRVMGNREAFSPDYWKQ